MPQDLATPRRDDGGRDARTRTVDGLLVRARWVAIGALLVQFALYTPGGDHPLPFPRWPVAALLAATLLGANLVSMTAHSPAWTARLRRVGHLTTVLDTAVVLALLALFGFDTTARLWPLLILPILEAGLRERLRGALVAWAAGSVAYVVIDLAWMHHLEGVIRADVAGTSMAVLVLLVVTVGVGSLAEDLDRARENASSHADRLRELSRLSPTLTGVRDPGEALTQLLSAGLRLADGHAARLFVLSDDGWEVAASAPDEDTAGVLTELMAQQAVRGDGDADDALLAVPVPLRDERDAVMLVARRPQAPAAAGTHEALALLAAHAAVAARTAEVRATEARTIEELRELDRAKDDFLSVLAHDLRSPMTTVAGYADLLLSRWDRVPDERRTEFLGAISRASRRMSGLVQDVFDALQAEHAQLPTAPQIVTLEPLLADYGTQEVARSERHHLVLDVEPDAAQVWADAARLGQVLANLLSNAVKYSPDGGRIGLRAHREGDMVAIAVSDEGLGIAPEDRHLLFRRFVRLHAEAGLPGTGLGLYLCRTLVDAMGGTIEVTSQPGTGSTFTVRLPAVPVPDDPAAEQAPTLLSAG